MLSSHTETRLSNTSKGALITKSTRKFNWRYRGRFADAEDIKKEGRSQVPLNSWSVLRWPVCWRLECFSIALASPNVSALPLGFSSLVSKIQYENEVREQNRRSSERARSALEAAGEVLIAA